MKLNKSKWFDKDIFKDALSSDILNTLPKVINPLKFEKNRRKYSEEEEEEEIPEKSKSKSKFKDATASDEEFVSDYDDDNYILPIPLSDREKRKEKLKKKAIKDKKDKGEVRKEIEIVPQKKLEDYDIDELASTRALATKMLRLKDRDQIMENSYNRYFKPDDEDAPEWFAADERIHNMKILPITKEEYMLEKNRLMQIKNRPIRKVIK